MVDLRRQYHHIKEEVDSAISEVLESTRFVGGEVVASFQRNLEEYMGVSHVIPCANGTDALQIALMALGLQRGDEVIVPSFTYVATAEVIALLGLSPVMVDVDLDTQNVTAEIIAAALTPKTKAVVPVHLFGQSCDMAPIMDLAGQHGFYVVEDNAQAIGAMYTFPDGSQKRAGTIGHIGTTSFFPAKNLGCYGDGGAVFTQDDALAARLRMIANHGQSRLYYHDVIGCNSRLDALQAAVLEVKLRHLDAYCAARQQVADAYDAAFANVGGLHRPRRADYSTHVFHQYVPRLEEGRDGLIQHLKEHGVGCNIYYPVPLYQQKAFADYHKGGGLPVTEQLCREVFAIPIHTEMTPEEINYVATRVKEYFA